jgi:short-subunit dehydrogenase
MTARFRSVVITGASSGIGAALARLIAGPEIALLLIGRRDEALNSVAEVCRASGAVVEVVVVDVREPAPLAACLTGFDARHPVDLAIANAGIEHSVGPDREFEMPAAASEQIRTNLEGAINTITPLLAPMRRRRTGAIGLVASLAGIAPVPDQPAYSASKAGLIAWGEALMPLLAADDISVSIICPGFVATRMAENYRGRRPMQMTADEAARRILRGLERRQAVIAFPAALSVAARLGMIAPTLRRAVMNRLFRARVER